MTDKDLQNIDVAEYIINKLNEREDRKRINHIVDHLYTATVTVLVTVMVIGFDWFNFKLAVAKWWGRFL
jgi:hypothetical protein